MDAPLHHSADSQKPTSAKSIDVPVLLAVWASFLLFSLVAAPIPSVNEPHYLCKARHFWSPQWCANDFFLTSSNAHTVFYATFGSLTNWLPFDQSAWLGRAIALMVVAAGWCSLIASIFQDDTDADTKCRWTPLYVCWTFLGLQACGSFSGEWLIGGIEGKVVSYGLLFGAVGQIYRNRLILAGTLTGVGIAFHPVIGVWAVLAFAGMRLSRILLKRFRSDDLEPLPQSTVTLRRAAMAIVASGISAIPGLIPVFQLLAEPSSAKTRAAANFIQVYYRLAHHLDPMAFLPRAYLGYAALLLIWVTLMYLGRQSPRLRQFDGIVAMSIVFAVAGIIIGWGPRPAQNMVWYAQRAQLLKFYPFRLADILVPLAVAMAVVRWLPTLPRKQVCRLVCIAFAITGAGMILLGYGLPRDSDSESLFEARRVAGFMAVAGLGVGVATIVFRLIRQRTSSVAYGLVFLGSLALGHLHADTNRFTAESRADWIAACRWVDTNLPTDVLVHSPHNAWTFKWYAHRAEYVSFKDCPQDAAGIVEWNRRLSFLKRWFEQKYDDELYSVAELREFRAATQVTHILTDRLGPMELEPVYRNDSFQLYDLTTLDQK